MQQFASIPRRTGKSVVDKHHAVPDKDLVFDSDGFTDERVRRYFAARTDHCTRLHFDKGADQGLVPNNAAIQVYQFGLRYAHPVAKLNVVADRHAPSPG